MNNNTMPAVLQEPHRILRTLRRPSEPYLHTTVKDSESALEGESILELLLYALVPWWAKMFFEGGGISGDESEKDYIILTPLSFFTMCGLLMFNTDMGGWEILGVAIIIATVTLVALIVFHLIFHKSITMYIYNHVFRRAWMHEMNASDQKRYLADVAAYPQLLKEHEAAYKNTHHSANTALTAYNATNPAQGYKIGDYGFEKISMMDKTKQIAGEKMKGMFKLLGDKATGRVRS